MFKIQRKKFEIDAHHFLKTFKELLDSEILTNYYAFEKDLDSCVSSIISKSYSKINEFNPKNSALFKEIKGISTNNKMLYCSFVTAISYAVLGVSPYKEAVNAAKRRISKKCKSRKQRQTCNLLVSKIMQLNDKYKSETLGQWVTNSVNNLDELIELSYFNTFVKTTEDVEMECISLLTTINKNLLMLWKQNMFLDDSYVAGYFVKFYLKLYKMFQKNTVIEADTDLIFYKQILQTLELSFSVFKCQKELLIKGLFKYWPKNSYLHQVTAIEYFIRICKTLDDQENIDFEKVLFKKFDDLFLNSSTSIFAFAFGQSTGLRTIDHWLSKCSDVRSKKFEDSLTNLKVRQKKFLESKEKQINVFKNVLKK